MFSTRSGCSTLPITSRLGSDEELVARTASGSAARSSSPNTSVFTSARSVTDSMTSHAPSAALRRPPRPLAAAGALGPRLGRLLTVGDVAFDGVAPRLDLLGGRVEEPDVAAAGGEDGGNEAAEGAGAEDRHRPLAGVFGE